MKPLQPGASREEVLAAVEEAERREREHVRPVFPERPDGFVGCVTSLDGSAVACHRPGAPENPALTRQRTAGEEDQSRPGWDSTP